MKHMLTWTAKQAPNVLLAASLAGCSVDADSIGSNEWCKAHRCEVAETTFDPEPGLLEYTEAMIVRISRATGRTDLAIREGGIPVFFEEDLAVLEQTSEGTMEMVPKCGVTDWSHTYYGPPWIQGISIDPTPSEACASIPVIVLHEAIHALSPHAEHSEDGVFHPRGVGSRLEETSLTALCSEFSCQVMNPE